MPAAERGARVHITLALCTILGTSNNFVVAMAHPANHTAGKHFILDFWGAEKLTDAAAIEAAMRGAADVAGAVLLNIHLHRFAENEGLTGVALLAESHITVHTWPEHNYVAFDVFMCGGAQSRLAVDYLKATFKPQRCEIKEIDRGV